MVSVLGWQKWHRRRWPKILSGAQSLGQAHCNESVSSELASFACGTKALGPGEIGPGRGPASCGRLEADAYLTGELPGQLKGRTIQSIDLSDPDKPELGLPAAPAKEAAKGFHRTRLRGRDQLTGHCSRIRPSSKSGSFKQMGFHVWQTIMLPKPHG